METLPICVVKYLFTFLSTESKGRFRQTCHKYSKLEIDYNILIKKYKFLDSIADELMSELDEAKNLEDDIHSCHTCFRIFHVEGNYQKECPNCNKEYCEGCYKYTFVEDKFGDVSESCFICDWEKCVMCDDSANKICYICHKLICHSHSKIRHVVTVCQNC